MPLTKNPKDYQPCQVMPRIDFESYKEFPDDSLKQFMLTVSYPQQVKIITQSRAVDVNSLIGNIGGYIGLFLGMLYYHNFFAYSKAYINQNITGTGGTSMKCSNHNTFLYL